LLLAEGLAASEVVDEIVRRAEELGLPLRSAERARLDMLTDGAHHQGVCLLATVYSYEDLPDLLPGESDALYLVLDSLQDPQNLGAVLRTAEAVAVTGVVLPRHRAAEVTPTVVNASAGAAEHLRVAQVVNLARALEDLKESGAWVVGLEAAPSAVPLWEVRLDGRLALVVGSEGEGIRRLVLEKCDVVAKLPLLGRVGSLNASAAAAVALYEALRHRM
jgi:23S rRNA (guanosine2251-2'-O)-methyltransferase